jgi:hypothetical protein
MPSSATRRMIDVAPHPVDFAFNAAGTAVILVEC